MDGSGELDKEEVGSIFAKKGVTLTADELDEAFVMMDKDGNGDVDMEEFKVRRIPAYLSSHLPYHCAAVCSIPSLSLVLARSAVYSSSASRDGTTDADTLTLTH